MKKQIMKRAWEIAREASVKFGGSSKSYFSESLRISWSEYKLPSYGEWKNSQAEYKPSAAIAELTNKVEEILEKSRSNDCYYMEEELY